MGTGMGSFHSLCSFSIGTFPIPHDDERYHSTLRSYMFYELVLWLKYPELIELYYSPRVCS